MIPTLLCSFFVFSLPTDGAILPLVINTWNFENANLAGEFQSGVSHVQLQIFYKALINLGQ